MPLMEHGPVADGGEAATAAAVVYSIGYEGRTAAELIGLLTARGIGSLVDVRLNAVSRKKGLSKTALREAAAASIAYAHEPDLGNPRDNRDGFRQGSPAARSRYIEHLRNRAGAAYARVMAVALAQRTALLCYERDHNECHRSCILEEARRSHGIAVEPIR